MKISVKKDIDRFYLVINGNPDDESDLKLIQKYLTIGLQFPKLAIAFEEIDVLSKEFMEHILKLYSETESDRISFSTNKRYLSSMLGRFGIPVIYRNLGILQKINKGTCQALALGGSAGSLEKIMYIIEGLPLADISVFIVQHIRPEFPNRLNEILAPLTPYNVVIPDESTAVELKTIYIAPANKHMVVKGMRIHLLDTTEINYSRPSIDVLFESLAHVYKNQLVTVLLCGFGEDGSASQALLQNLGACTLLLDETECKEKEMLKNAARYIPKAHHLQLKELRNVLFELLPVSNMNFTDETLLGFMQFISDRFEYDFSEYNAGTLRRRLSHFMLQNKYETLAGLKNHLVNDNTLFQRFFYDLSINTTSFFRDFDVLNFLNKEIIPTFDTYPHLRIWCAGCSTGEEVYTLAFLLKKAGLYERSHIYATDFNPSVIEVAQNGIYPDKYIERIPTEFQNDIERTNNGYFKIGEGLKTNMTFSTHNLEKDSRFNRFHLVTCRNVLIYFNNSLQSKVIRLLSDSLIPNGILLLGKSESILSPENYGLEIRERLQRMYKKSGEVYVWL